LRCDFAQPKRESGTVKYGFFISANISANKTVTQQYHAKIYVTLRPSVLDPAGTAVRSGLSHLGYDNVEQIRIGKYIELTLNADTQQAAETQLDRMCDQLLANTVIENYRFELMPLAAATGVS
jgi:phosphoribosylformylglycinamidine synthase subunit PurS